MSAEKIINEWKKGNFKPVYWLEGDETYFIDKIVDYAETSILSKSEVQFNLQVMYGKDTSITDLRSICKTYPMFGERQVVIVKEAQNLKQIEQLEIYINEPQPSTLLVIAYKEKKLDARTKFAKTVKAKGEVLTTKKLYDNELPGWTMSMLATKGLTIDQKALMLMIDHIGNDLSRIENEVDKLIINLKERKNITSEDIEIYVGISKDFNSFELQKAIAYKNFPKAIRIIQYFAANPKVASIQMILPNLYSFFSKVAVAYSLRTSDEKVIASGLGIPQFVAKDYTMAMKNYSYQKVEYILLYLHHYNLRSIGVNDTGTADSELLKELIVKIMN